jgi:hypothetical protein
MAMPEEIRRALEQAKQRGQITPQAYEFITANLDAIRFAIAAAVTVLVVSSIVGQFSEWLGPIALLAGAWIAWQIWRKRQAASASPALRTAQAAPGEWPGPGAEVSLPRRTAASKFPLLLLVGAAAGAMLWFLVPESRAFVLGALVGGLILAILKALFRYWSR